MRLKKNKFHFPEYGWIMALFFLVFFLLQIKNNRFEMNDFKVYYLGMQHFIKGDAIYGIPFGLQSGFYKYSPSALIPFAVFYYMPFILAAISYYFLLASAAIVLMYKVFKLLQHVYNYTSEKQSAILYISTLILLNHFYRELHLGNLNLLLLLLYIVSLERMMSNHQFSAGIFMGIGLLFKLHFIVLLPVLLLFRKFKTSFSMLITFIMGLLLPAFFLGFEANKVLLKAWLETMKTHNSTISSSADTVYEWINKILSITGLQQYGILYTAVILLVIAAFFLWFIYKNKQTIPIRSDLQRFTLVYLLVIAVIPNITVTDSEHFLFSLPIVMLSLFMLFSEKSLTIWAKSIIIIAFVFYGGNWHDLWGHTISVFFTQNGFLGLGNMMLIGFVVYKTISTTSSQ